MDRDRLAPVAIAVLAVLALGVGAASIDSPTNAGGGSGTGGGSGGFLGEGSTFDLGQPAPSEPSDGPTIPKLVFQAIIVALVAAFFVGLYVFRDEIGLDDLKTAGVLSVVVAGVVVALYFLFGLFGGDNSVGKRGVFGRNTPVFPGGGGDTSLDGAAQTVSANPLLAFVLGAVLLVGAVVVLRSTEETDDTEPETEPTESPKMAEIGRAAGRAADRIAGEATVENEVYRAWREMTDGLEMANPESSTPGEFACAATDAGMRSRDVTELTDLFRTVRYGGSEVTADRETRAVAALRRIEDEYAEEP